eukprot:TRINITY_DN185477_c0_g1_i1.p1 TRINITY_DN185477_c0_g1~~TRINITY_DN185477_c0_g1_i1.p1  ORF type:complete len:403 (+),score=31.89 TRINITY_DN185477_c0_g1_i1:14-1222(+)
MKHTQQKTEILHNLDVIQIKMLVHYICCLGSIFRPLCVFLPYYFHIFGFCKAAAVLIAFSVLLSIPSLFIQYGNTKFKDSKLLAVLNLAFFIQLMTDSMHSFGGTLSKCMGAIYTMAVGHTDQWVFLGSFLLLIIIPLLIGLSPRKQFPFAAKLIVFGTFLLAAYFGAEGIKIGISGLCRKYPNLISSLKAINWRTGPASLKADHDAVLNILQLFTIIPFIPRLKRDVGVNQTHVFVSMGIATVGFIGLAFSGEMTASKDLFGNVVMNYIPHHIMDIRFGAIAKSVYLLFATCAYCGLFCLGCLCASDQSRVLRRSWKMSQGHLLDIVVVVVLSVIISEIDFGKWYLLVRNVVSCVLCVIFPLISGITEDGWRIMTIEKQLTFVVLCFFAFWWLILSFQSFF